jgi:hypothetical protein
MYFYISIFLPLAGFAIKKNKTSLQFEHNSAEKVEECGSGTMYDVSPDLGSPKVTGPSGSGTGTLLARGFTQSLNSLSVPYSACRYENRV